MLAVTESLQLSGAARVYNPMAPGRALSLALAAVAVFGCKAQDREVTFNKEAPVYPGGDEAPNVDDEVTVEVYAGIQECDDSEKIRPNMWVKMQYSSSFGDEWTGEEIHPDDHVEGSGTVYDTTGKKHFSYFQHKLVDAKGIQKGLYEGLDGLCPGAIALLTIPPLKAFGWSSVTVDKTITIPPGTTIFYEVEIFSVTKNDPRADRNDFIIFDTNGDGEISEAEAAAFFGKKGAKKIPDSYWSREDKNHDKVVTWEEFSGPKGTRPTQDTKGSNGRRGQKEL